MAITTIFLLFVYCLVLIFRKNIFALYLFMRIRDEYSWKKAMVQKNKIELTRKLCDLRQVLTLSEPGFLIYEVGIMIRIAVTI